MPMIYAMTAWQTGWVPHLDVSGIFYTLPQRRSLLNSETQFNMIHALNQRKERMLYDCEICCEVFRLLNDWGESKILFSLIPIAENMWQEIVPNGLITLSLYNKSEWKAWVPDSIRLNNTTIIQIKEIVPDGLITLSFIKSRWKAWVPDSIRLNNTAIIQIKEINPMVYWFLLWYVILIERRESNRSFSFYLMIILLRR
jgi:hypothetical protein